MFKKPISTLTSTTTREAQAVFRILQGTVLASLAGAIGTLLAINYFGAAPETIFVITLLTGLLVPSFILLQRNILWPARVMAPLSLFATITYLLISGSGIHDISIVGYGGILIISSLTLGKRGVIVSAILIVAAVFSVANAEMNNTLVTDASALTTPDDPFLISIVILSMAFAQSALITRMESNLQDVRDYAQTQFESNRELTELKNSLEERVLMRTNELAQANESNAHRAILFESIARIARSVTSLDDQSVLLHSVAEQIGQRFNYEYVALHAASGPRREETRVAVYDQSAAGSASLASDSTFDPDTLAGVVFASGLARTVFNEEADAVFFSTPAWASFNSQIALPLIAGERVVGVIHIFSKRTRAFDTAEVFTLSILADVVSNALEGSKQFQQTRASLDKSVSAYSEELAQAWGRFKREEGVVGYRYSGGVSEPLHPQRGNPSIVTIAETTRVDVTAEGKEARARMVVPVRLRGEALGNLEINMPAGHVWSDDDIEIVETVAERLALSMENARLFQSSANRAERERVVADITAKIRQTNDPQAMIRTAIEELQRALGVNRVEIVPQAASAFMPGREQSNNS